MNTLPLPSAAPAPAPHTPVRPPQHYVEAALEEFRLAEALEKLRSPRAELHKSQGYGFAFLHGGVAFAKGLTRPVEFDGKHLLDAGWKDGAWHMARQRAANT